MGCVSGVSSVSLASSESVSATLRLESTEESDPQRNELLEMASQHWPIKWYEQHVAAPALTRKVYVYYIYIYPTWTAESQTHLEILEKKNKVHFALQDKIGVRNLKHCHFSLAPWTR